MTIRKGSPSYSLWLMPEASWAEKLEAVIDELAPVFGTPEFTPHVTVQGSLELPPETIGREIGRLCASIESPALEVLDVESSSFFFRSLFLRFREDPGFDGLKVASGRSLGTEKGFPPFPHLSLGYGDGLGAREKKTLIDRLTPVFRGCTIGFPKLALALSASTVPIEEWKILEEFPLLSR
jgi:hypothetical protein